MMQASAYVQLAVPPHPALPSPPLFFPSPPFPCLYSLHLLSSPVCGSKKTYSTCCGILHKASELGQFEPRDIIRARYSAYALGLGPFLIRTTHRTQRDYRIHFHDAVRDPAKVGNTEQANAMQHNIIQHNVKLQQCTKHDTTQCNAMQHNTTKCNATPPPHPTPPHPTGLQGLGQRARV